MKRLASIFLLFSLMLPLLGTYTWFSLERYLVRKQIKKQIIAGIDKSDLIFLMFSKEESENLSWEHEGEFEFHGQMYDVVYREQVQDSMYYWCWWDHEETRLNRELSELVNKAMNTDSQSKKKQQVQLFLSLLFHEKPGLYLVNDLTVTDKISAHYFNTYQMMSNPPPVPPPRC